jgi:hypothetical protein
LRGFDEELPLMDSADATVAIVSDNARAPDVRTVRTFLITKWGRK